MSLTLLQENKLQKNFNIQLKDNLENIVAQDKFDAISMCMCWSTYMIYNYFEHFRTLLNNNGTLAIAVPNYTLRCKNVPKILSSLMIYLQHLGIFSPKSMKELANSMVLFIKILCHAFDPFYIALLSEKNKQSNFR
ncbi:MAG: hypothetical protein R2836_05590 [Chitinophagales bacterium]